MKTSFISFCVGIRSRYNLATVTLYVEWALNCSFRRANDIQERLGGMRSELLGLEVFLNKWPPRQEGPEYTYHLTGLPPVVPLDVEPGFDEIDVSNFVLGLVSNQPGLECFIPDLSAEDEEISTGSEQEPSVPDDED